MSKFEPYTATNGFIKVRLIGGGAVPDVLSGIFTSLREADKAILKYDTEVTDTKPIKTKSSLLPTVE